MKKQVNKEKEKNIKHTTNIKKSQRVEVIKVPNTRWCYSMLEF